MDGDVNAAIEMSGHSNADAPVDYVADQSGSHGASGGGGGGDDETARAIMESAGLTPWSIENMDGLVCFDTTGRKYEVR
jgi:hypothetical protein